MRELLAYTAEKQKKRAHSHYEMAKYMANVVVWVTEGINYLKNQHFLSLKGSHTTKCGEEMMKNMT